MTLTILNIETESLGDRSYLVHDGNEAILVDPQRDEDRIQNLLTSLDLTLKAVVETHMHNDYISGGYQLSKDLGAKYVVHAKEKVLFERYEISDGELLEFSSFALKAIHTPGHTFNHLAFELLNSTQEIVGVFTGGSLLHGSTGRPDLLGLEFAKELAGLQYLSAHNLAATLPNSIPIYPTHGFGSFCSVTPTNGGSSKLADEVRENPVFLLSKLEFVQDTVGKLDAYPSYFKYMGAINEGGAKGHLSQEQKVIGLAEVKEFQKNNGQVIDLRDRSQWSKEHLSGSICLSLDGSMASYAGWLTPFADEILLISTSNDDLQEGKRELFRIGFEKIEMCHLIFDSLNTPVSTQTADFSQLESALSRGAIILDVRQDLEREKSHLEPSLHIPLHELAERIQEVPKEKEIWIHCASGYRAAAAIGILERFGLTPTLINDVYESAPSTSSITIVTNQE